MLNTLLRDTDVMCMAHGLEQRVPLIDHKLAGKLLAIPGSWKLDNNNVPKPLLVSALQGALPDQVLRRTKRGFTFPFAQWLGGILRPELEATLQKIGKGPLASLLNQDSVLHIWNHFLNKQTSPTQVWSLYVLERWCELNSVTA